VSFLQGEGITLQRISVDWSIASTTEFEPSLKRFRRYLEDQGIRESTITGYVGNIHRYLKFAGTIQPSPQDLDRFKDYMADRKMARSTRNQYQYAIRAYHFMLGDPVEIKRLEPNNQIPYYLDIIKIFSCHENA
jgi:hypothetical protein